MLEGANSLFLRLQNSQYYPAVRKLIRLGVPAVAFIFFFARLALDAWVCDDAFITFRVVDNFVHGYGLRWNISERVQVFTNPLWMLLHIPFYALWHNIFLITIGLSFACIVGCVLLVTKTFPKSAIAYSLFFIMPLALSKPWREFAISGLENPLSFLLFAVYGYYLFQPGNPRRVLFLCLTASFAMVNRLDVGLIYAPSLFFILAQAPRKSRIKTALLGALPIVSWLIFSVCYYGFLFPNTKYAKLNTGIPNAFYIQQGFFYFKDFILTSSNSALLLLLGLLTPLYCIRRLSQHRPWLKGTRQNYWLFISIALGVLAYLIYIFCIGGDFMSGRFFTLPIFIATWLVYGILPKKIPGIYGVALLSILQLAFTVSATAAKQIRPDEMGLYEGIADERRWYSNGTVLIDRNDWSLRSRVTHGFAYDAENIRKDKKKGLISVPCIGMMGYYLGSNFTLIDNMGLADPLLARLPAKEAPPYRIGHFFRDSPKGYWTAVETGNIYVMDKPLARYYKKLQILISNDIWSTERFKTIAFFNLGNYDHFRDLYLQDIAKKG